MLERTLGKSIAYTLADWPKVRAQWQKRRLAKKKHKEHMIKIFGKKRYFWSKLFGEWALYAGRGIPPDVHFLYAKEVLKQCFKSHKERQHYAYLFSCDNIHLFRNLQTFALITVEKDI